MSNDSLLGGISEYIQIPTYDDDKVAAVLCNWAYDYYNGIRITKEYQDWTICPDNFIRDKLGSKFQLTVKSTGFQSLLFTKQKNGYTYYAYCTVGTNSLSDWLTANFLQWSIGISPQYTRSVQNAKLLHDFAIEKKAILWFIGHSLGGGLASNNSLITGRYAITFDAAGLNFLRVKMSLLLNLFYKNREKVLFNYSKRQKKIHAYILRGEILNRLLQCCFQKAYGMKGDMYIIRPQIKEIQEKSSREKHDLSHLIKELELYKSNEDYLNKVIYSNYERLTD